MAEPARSARQKDGYILRPEEAIEPEMSENDWRDFGRGITLFNNGQFWDSHEAWESVWKRHREPSRIFFQGLIQLAASHHQLNRGIYHGVEKHYNNAYLKLVQFPDSFLGVDLGMVKERIRQGLVEAARVGEEGLMDFDPSLVVKIESDLQQLGD